jgi:hypothetical protein
MPRYDGTGPVGRGTMTGHGRGLCITDEPEKTGRLLSWGGRGLGRVLGRGFGGRGGARGGLSRGMHRGWRS